MKMAVFWVVAPCSLVKVYRRFGGACCLYHHRPDDGGSKYGATTQKTAIFTFSLIIENCRTYGKSVLDKNMFRFSLQRFFETFFRSDEYFVRYARTPTGLHLVTVTVV
jgi:hypothetical protein